MQTTKKLVILLFLAASACTTAAPTKGIVAPTITPPSQEAALVRNLLIKLQHASIEQGVEFCGFVGTNPAGKLVLSEPVRGDQASCLPRAPRNIQIITASYHTHGGYSPDYLGELPSPEDVAGDFQMGINGYVSTPGGRLWFIDYRARQLIQICGFGCLPNDARFQRGGDGPIAQSYSFAALSHRHAS